MNARAKVLTATGIGKRYGGVAALADVDFELAAGEVRALVGANGAGKSTLVKILTGAVAPSAGTVSVGGVAAVAGQPAEMIRLGVACIYQHSNLVPRMSVMDNIFLGRQPAWRAGLLDRRRQRAQALALMDHHGIALDPDAIVAELPTVKQKEVEILKALALDARVLLMDEPTAWLSAREVQRLHATIRSLRAGGVAIVYISHMLDEIFSVCDTATVLRDGRCVAQCAVADTTRARLVEHMMGEPAPPEPDRVRLERAPAACGRVRLRCAGLGKRGVFRDIGFEVHGGEILCITGLIGSGRTELLHAMFGSDTFDTGRMELDGHAVRFRSPREAVAHGLALVPEDRHRDGLMLDLSVAENLAMVTLRRHCTGFLLAAGRLERAARNLVRRLGVRVPGMRSAVRSLSGGNQQKVLLGKWLDLGPEVLMLDEPTVGVDVGAKAEIYRLLREQRDQGAAILVVSSDLEEVMALADRVGVMAGGRLVGVHEAATATRQRIMEDLGAAA